MGRKGARLTAAATTASEDLVARLADLGDVSSRKMFGGYGIFADGVMFGLVTSEGVVHFKVTEENLPRYTKAGAEKYGRMPYYSVPATVLSKPKSLQTWATEAIRIASAAKAQ